MVFALPLAAQNPTSATGSIYMTAYDDKGATIESDKYAAKPGATPTPLKPNETDELSEPAM